ncbi:hypothetical protein [Petropleomorpha daqingensis]|uniref:Uncharacterized protein n=1 Tax=Petropleomorpha daqingensis TaxID=2026353 RepID=A0A853CH95_9ACTN|nr:hypothetical protein [Petropleomorpha daqingensis]NYJ05423.1 hypothetical protein [Petropleomorpha daqingensis]
MSTDRNDAGDGRDEGAGWREPSHLGGGQDRSGEPDRSAPWEPPGWSLPPAERGPAQEEYQGPPPTAEPPAADRAGGWLGSWGGPAEEPLVVGESSAQDWAIRHGWTLSDGTGPQDAVLQELIDTAPARRIGKEHRATGVVRGRAGSIELVAFDVTYVSGRVRQVEYAVTAAPVLIPLPRMRLSPARLWKHRTGGLLQLPSGDAEFDTRWVLLTEQDTPELRRLVADPAVRGLLLAGDDRDEFWTAGGHLAAIRALPHRGSLIEHHARLLGACLGALAGV